MHIDGYFDPDSASDLDVALARLQEAVVVDPTYSGAWYDLGLVHKWRREWPESLACNQRAVATRPRPEEEDPACWNGGIAATALHDWAAARELWRGYGVNIPDGEGPIDGRFGMTSVRLLSGEGVWGQRLDPARVLLDSIPLPESGNRSGDIILIDGAPEGERIVQGRRFPMFPAILTWARSAVPTTQIDLAADSDDVDDLARALVEADLPAENWTSSIVVHCPACSKGSIDLSEPGHDHGAPPDSGPSRIGCSGHIGEVEAFVISWCAARGINLIGIAEVG